MNPSAERRPETDCGGVTPPVKPSAEQRPELLAPAGSMDALRAAVQNGADAVYLGYGSFHARARVGFSDDDFHNAVRYCRLYGVRVYLTLNTLLTDRKLSAALEQARTASRLGVDAVLVQDWGLLSLLRACLPDLPVHASTQMSAFTSGGVRTLYDNGCQRVVAARECSRDDIAALCQRGGAEIAVFVHGALCVCYSGQCEMSALLGGRSGNRGRCAQPCRLPCSAGTKFRPNDYALSLKDLNWSSHLEELRSIGVACLKIEGRLKRPEYVAIVTGVYARLLRERRGPSAEETALLETAFSRSGFTDAYWSARPGPHMFGVRADAPDPKDLFQQARATYEKDASRKVPVRAACTLRAGEPVRLSVSDDDGHSVAVTGPVPEPARTRPLTAQSVAERLSRTGGTPYAPDDIRVDAQDGLSLPVSALNALRRDALDALSVRRTDAPSRRECPPPPAPSDAPAPPVPRYTVSVCRPEQLVPDFRDLSPARVCVPLDWFSGDITLPGWLSAVDTELCAVLPRVWRDRDEPRLRDFLHRAVRQRVRAVLVGNIGHLSLVRESPAFDALRLYGDFGLNVMNAYAAAWLAGRGLSSVCASFELRTEQLRDMKKPLPLEAIVYGRLPLMILENRPGGRRADVLTDRANVAFPLLDAFGGRVELQNSRPLWLADRDAWRHAGLSLARLRFTTESPADCVRTVRGYLDCTPADGPFTRGLYERGVE